MMVPSPTFYILLRNFNPVSDLISPQLRSTFNSYNREVLDLFKSHWEAKNSNTPVQSLGAFFSQLDSKLSNINDLGIIEGWRSYYKSQPESVKVEFLKRTPNPVFLGKNMPYAKTISMGNILSGPVAPPANIPKSKIPTNLVDVGMPVPSYITSNLAFASTVLGKLFNKNIQSVIDTVSTSDKPHGSNLVADSKHVERASKIISPFMKKVLNKVGGAGKFVLSSINYNPFGVQNSEISAPNIALEQTVEGRRVVVNALGQDLSSITKPVSLKDYISPKKRDVA
jgi:hypothetical protein